MIALRVGSYFLTVIATIFGYRYIHSHFPWWVYLAFSRGDD